MVRRPRSRIMACAWLQVGACKEHMEQEGAQHVGYVRLVSSTESQFVQWRSISAQL